MDRQQDILFRRLSRPAVELALIREWAEPNICNLEVMVKDVFLSASITRTAVLYTGMAKHSGNNPVNPSYLS